MIQDALHKMSFGLKTRAEVWQLLADFTASGMEVGLALETAAVIYRERGASSVAYILMQMRHAMSTGSPLPVLRRFSNEADQLMFSGWGSIEAAPMFAAAARIARAQLVLRRAVVSALAGPAMALAALTGLYYILGTRLFPAVRLIAEPETWPFYARLIDAVSGAVARNALLIGPGLAAAAVLLGLSCRYWTGFGRGFADRLPPWSFVRLQTGMMFLMLLVESGRMGLTLNTAFLLELARQSGPYVRSRITAIARLSGNDPAGIGRAAMRCGNGWPAPALNTALAAYSRQDGWLESFSKYLDRWMETVEIQAKASAQIVNFVLLTLVALSIGAVLLTMFGLTSAVQSGGRW